MRRLVAAIESIRAGLGLVIALIEEDKIGEAADEMERTQAQFAELMKQHDEDSRP